MSIEPKETCPPPIQTVLEIWQSTLVEARLNNRDALSAAAMLMGYVCLNVSTHEDVAHRNFSDLIFDIHKYIEANWEQAQEMRRAARRRRGE
jgi:hypothetical protein